MHSRRLSETIDVNYGEIHTTSDIELNKDLPPPPIEKDEKYKNTSGIIKTRKKTPKNKNTVRFDPKLIMDAPIPVPRTGRSSSGNKKRKSALKNNGRAGDYSRLPTANDQMNGQNQFTTINFSDDDNDGLTNNDIELNEINDNNEYNGADQDFDSLFQDDDPMFTADTRTLSFWSSLIHPKKEMFEILFYIVGWYTFSISISFYNKWMFDKSKLNFPFPIISTSIHQLILFILSSLLLGVIPKYRPPTESLFSMDLKLLLLSVIPCAIATSGDIGCGNMSLRYVSLSLYTMIKSSAIAFVLIFGVIFKLEKLSLDLCCIVFIMMFGVMMMVGGSTNTSATDKGDAAASSFDLFLGSLLVLVSSCMSGLRWALTQLLLKTNPYISNPITTMFYLAPWMFITLLLIGSFTEGLLKFFQNDIWTNFGFLKTIIALCIPGFLVFFMMIFELRLLQKSHVVTLSIAGIFKELLTILFSSFIFGDKLTVINVLGLIVTLLDILWYNYYRYSENIKESKDDHDSIQEFELRDRL